MKLTQEVDNLLIDNSLQHSISTSGFQELVSSRSNKSEILSLLALLQKRGARPQELAALATIVRKSNRIKLNLPGSLQLCDACGTGGDKAGTFNISTISSMVAASAGAFVVKHGNYSITSKCGSSDLMEALGINLNCSTDSLKKCLLKSNILYLHAPRFSGAFSFLKPIRSELAAQQIKTIFNLLGPLVNPIGVKRQIIGVYDSKLVPVVAKALSLLDTKLALVFHSTSFKMDELIPNNQVMICEVRGKAIRKLKINWKQMNLRKPTLRELRGGNAITNQQIAINILRGRDRGARRDTVLLNSAAILYVSGRASSLSQGIELSRKAIDSGCAIQTLNQLKNISHGA